MAAILELLALIVTDLLYGDAILRFHGLRCGKFSISVWLSAPGTRLDLTRFLGRRVANRTRHGEHLFQREFLSFHQRTIQRSSIWEMLNIAHFQRVTQRGRLQWVREQLLRIVSKSEHLLRLPF